MDAIFLSLILASVLFPQMEGWRPYLDYRRFPTQPTPLSKYTNLMFKKNIWRKDQLPQNEETVYLVIYYESLCEDSRDLFTSQLLAAYELLEPYLDVRLIPYGKATTRVEDSADYYSFTCQHGPSECYGNKLHACALEILSSDTASLFNICLMDYDQKDQGSDDLAADKCGRALGLNVKEVKECAKSKTGNFLLNYYGDRTKMVKFKYVPHVLVNGVYNNGTQLIADICATLEHPPPECKIFTTQIS